MQIDNYYVFFKAKAECKAIVIIITDPPMIVSMLGCSLITSQTQIGPNIVSSKKKRFTSAAVIYLGAKVTNCLWIRFIQLRFHLAPPDKPAATCSM